MFSKLLSALESFYLCLTVNKKALRNQVNTAIKKIFSHSELLFWVAAVFFLFLMDPLVHHFTLCPFQSLGFDHCPGCGLGRSCAMALNGDLLGSLSMHPFGIFAILVIFNRIYSLIRDAIKFNQSKFQKL